MKKWCIYIVISLAWFAGRGQSQQCVEELKKERQQKFAAVRTGDSMMKIGQHSFNAAVVVFYKTTCPFCERLMPQLKKLKEKYEDKGLAVYAVCLDEDKKAWQRYTDSNGLKAFYHYCDGLSYAGKIADAYHVFATPSLFLVNNNWCIAAKPKTPEQLEQEIIKLCY